MADRTEVEPWVVRMVEDTYGGPPVVKDKFYEHPEDGVIQIKSGQYWGTHGLSNFWYWLVVATGEMKHGYAGRWPETKDPNADDASRD